jgi:diguanylate cyclase (GGDEF)-like protein
VKILLADDSRVARELTASYLHDMGHPVVQAADGGTALALFAEEKPDLVLLDVEMPGMNGYTVAREMRRRDEGSHWVPIIFLNGRVGDDDILLGIDAGGDDYIAKPVSPIVLRAKLNAMRRLTDMQQRLLEMIRQMQHVNRELDALSASDELTGIANHRAFVRSLELEWQRGVRSGNSISLIIGNVDFFKEYNDTYGRQSGEACLRAVAAALAATSRRPTDLVARFGGEEFAMLLPETPLFGAIAVAERRVAAIRTLAIPHASSDVAPHVTMSFGVAACVASDALTPDRLVEAAHAALYEAKSNGRDRVASHPLAIQASG